jgi:hypothetical protein
MFYRMLFSVGLVLCGLFGLTACQLFVDSTPHFGPISTTSTIGLSEHELTYQLRSSTNCLAIGDPITVTLIVTNTGTTTYTADLPISIIDVRATSTRAGVEHTWQWSDTIPPAAQVRMLSLAPQESLTLEWALHEVPTFRDTALGRLRIRPLLRYRDPYQDGRIVDFEGGGYLVVPVGSDTALGQCRFEAAAGARTAQFVLSIVLLS